MQATSEQLRRRKIDPLGRLTDDPSREAIAIHYRVAVQTLAHHLHIQRIRKLVSAEIVDVRPDLTMYEAGQLADRCFHERYGNLVTFLRLPPDEKSKVPI